MELVRVDRREVLLGPQARDADGVLAVGEDLLVLARFGLALAPRVRRGLGEPRGAALLRLRVRFRRLGVETQSISSGSHSKSLGRL